MAMVCFSPTCLEIATPLIQTHAQCPLSNSPMYPIMLLPHTFNNESLSTMQGALRIVKCWSKMVLTAFKLSWSIIDSSVHNTSAPTVEIRFLEKGNYSHQFSLGEAFMNFGSNTKREWVSFAHLPLSLLSDTSTSLESDWLRAMSNGLVYFLSSVQ